MLQTTVFASDGGDSPVQAEAENSVVISAKSGILMDSTTGKVLFEKNANEKIPLASVTKIMTMLLVIESIEKGAISMDDIVTTSQNASSMGGSQIWLKEGEQMTVHDLLKATAVASANDAAMALAEHVSGSEESFVMKMNERATELNMKNTIFLNPTGLDANGHVSSAYDIALMSRELLKHEKIFEFTSTWMSSLRDGKTELVNTNKLVRFYKGATGLKTGTTGGAGSCVSATASRENMHLISVVMGCTTSKERFDDARRLLDYGFSHFVMYEIKMSSDKLVPIKVEGGVANKVDVQTNPENAAQSIIIPAGKEKSVTENIDMVSQIKAPVAKGQKLGSVTINIDDNMIAEFDITASDEVMEMTFTRAFSKMIKRLFDM